MKPRKPLQCPECGIAMNRHAEKVDYSATLRDPAAVDVELGGVVQEVHTCPACGKTEMRRSEPSPAPRNQRSKR